MKTANPKKILKTLSIKCPYCGMCNSCNIDYAGDKLDCSAFSCCETFKIPKLKDIK